MPFALSTYVIPSIFALSCVSIISLHPSFLLSFFFIRPPGTLVPEGLMFYPWCFFSFRHEISELPRPIAVKLCHVIASWVSFIMQVQKFGGPSPQRNWGPKHAKFGAISDNFRLRSWISPERDKISKIGKKCDHQRFLPRSTKKVGWTLVH